MISHGVTELKTSPHSVLAQKMCFSLPPTFFLESLPITRVHILHGDGRAWLIRIFHQQRGPRRGVSASGSCTQRRSPHGQVWIQTKGSDGLVRVACDREVQPPLFLCCNAMQPWLPHRSWTAHRAPAWHRPPQRGEAPQRGRKSSHRTWLGSGAAPWNPPPAGRQLPAKLHRGWLRQLHLFQEIHSLLLDLLPLHNAVLSSLCSTTTLSSAVSLHGNR